VAATLPLFVWAEDAVVSVDAKFDKTGDAMVDASDWSQMSEAERLDYARASLQALGEDPDAVLLKGKTRAETYLQGLRSVYK